MSTDLDVVDATVVDDQHDQTPASLPARRERRSEVIRPLAAGELIESFTAYQDLLPKLLSKDDWQDAGRGQRFVKKSGWRKIATAFDLDVTIVSSTVERDQAGTPLRAEVIARAIAPSGRSMDGDGYCSIDEDRFSGPRGNKAKLENDLRATATTRAKNRAISDLVGMGAASAEEVSAGPAAPPVPDWAKPANDMAAKSAIKRALGAAGVPDDRLQEFGPMLWNAVLAATGGAMPAVAAAAINAVADAAQAYTSVGEDAQVVDEEAAA